MATKERSRLVAALEGVPDPRRQCKNLRHRLVDVLVIGFCATATISSRSRNLAKQRRNSFAASWSYPNGIPSALRRILIERQIQANAQVNLEQCTFVMRSPLGMYSMHPEYLAVLANIIKEDGTKVDLPKT
jgi:hypothetical protein